MKILLPLSLCLFLIVSCERIEGQLNITKQLKLKNSKGDMQTIAVGTYNADVKAKTSKKITLRLNNDSDEKFIFEHNGNIPENGSFEIPSGVSGQPVDLSGSVATVKTNSEIREISQSCTYQEPVQVCYPVPRGPMNCSIQYRTVYGYQWIQYYDRHITKNVHLSVFAKASSESSGDFHGDISLVERIVLRQSACR